VSPGLVVAREDFKVWTPERLAFVSTTAPVSRADVELLVL
jgi:hypothetical protein